MDETDKPLSIDSRASKDARDWVVRLASGNMTDAELTRFKAWRDAAPEHAEAFARERLFWRQLDALDPHGQGRGAPAPLRQLDRRRLLLGGSAAAAAAGIAIVAAPRIKLLLDADYRTAPGEQANISLPDGSRVTLNTDSALALRFRPGLRLVELLQGEALFDVRAGQDAPFRVAALSGNSDAAGTSFAVRAIADRATVIVAHGEVRVFGPALAEEPSSGLVVQVKADQETSYARGAAPAPAAPTDPEQVLAWRSGRVIFDGRPFADALAELGRYVREPVFLANRARADDPVSAVFSIRQASTAIEALAQTQGMTARRIPGVMIIVS